MINKIWSKIKLKYNYIELYTFIMIFVIFMGSKFIRFNIFGVNFNLARILMIVPLFIIIVDFIKNKKIMFDFNYKPSKYCISFFIVWCLFSVASIYKNEDLMFYIIVNFYLCIGTIIIYFFYKYIDIKKNLIAYFYIIEGTVLVNCLYYLYLYYIMGENIGGFYHNSNDLATVLILSLEICIYFLLFNNNKKSRVIQSIIMIIFLFSFATILSRGCILGVVFSIFTSIILLVFKNRKKIFSQKKNIAFFAIIFIMLLFMGFKFYNKYVGKVSFKPVENAIMSNDVRVNLIYNGMYFLKQGANVITGIGAGNTITYLRDKSIYSLHKTYSFHNMWLELLVEYGIIIFIGFIIMYFKIIYGLYKMNCKNNNYQNVVYMFFWLAFIIASISSSTILTREWIWIVFAISVAFINCKKSRIINQKGKSIVFCTMLPLWSMNCKSGGKALFSTLQAYINAGYNVYFITNQKNDYSDLKKIDRKNIFYFNTSWYDIISSKIKGFFLYPFTFVYFKQFERKSYKIACKILENDYSDLVLYAYEVHSVKSLSQVHKEYDVPLITRFQGTIMSQYTNTWYNRILKYPHVYALSQKADLVIMTDDGTQGDKVLKKYKNDSHLLFIRNGVNILDKKIKKIDKDVYYNKLCIPKETTILLTVSRLTSWKRVDRSILSFSKLKNKEKYRLIIIGDGDSRRELEKLCDSLNLSKYVIFLGAIENSEVNNYMQFADIFLSFYDLSNVGNPLLEALCLGKPIITYDVGDTNTVIDGKNGILLKDVSDIKIAETIEKNNKPEILQYYSANALRYSKNNLYSWKKRMKIEITTVNKLYKKW